MGVGSSGGDGSRPGPGVGLRVGQRRRLAGDLDRNSNGYEAELNVYLSMHTAKDRPPGSKTFFAGVARPTQHAVSRGLRALKPVDKDLGWDLSPSSVRSHVHPEVQTVADPIGYTCPLYCLMNENANYHDRLDLLQRLPDYDTDMRQFAADIVEEQHNAGRLLLLENPLTSRLWKQPEILRLLDVPGVGVTSCHSGALGAEDSKGNPIRKPLRFAGNEPTCFKIRRLSDTDLLYCKPIQGKETKGSHVYPEALAYKIVDSLMFWLKQRQPQRLGCYEAFAIAKPVADPSGWMSVFNEVGRMLGSSTRAFLIDYNGVLGKTIADMFGMNLVRIQATITPV